MFRRMNARTAAARKLKNAAAIGGRISRRLERQRAQIDRDVAASHGLFGQPYWSKQPLAQLAARRARKAQRRGLRG
jgi:hypothetical protein